jgi:hypothetical protein
MAIRMTKAFTPLTEATVQALPGHMGVYQLADTNGQIQFVGYAGGKSLFGLRGEIADQLTKTAASTFRVEITTAYLTRYRELLMSYRADHDCLPPENDPALVGSLGRL